ncbi:MAG TPA: hypothetical protein VLA16_09245 [Ideonella sp.]|nr:hypothetical protein [Ideonella sp.]
MVAAPRRPPSNARRQAAKFAGLTAAGLLAAAACRAETAEALHHALAQCAAPPAEGCLAALEARALKEAAGQAERAGPWLSLQTTGGPVRFDDRRAVVATNATTPAAGGAGPRNYYLGAVEGSDARLVLALAPGAPLSAARYWLVGAAGPPVLGLDALPWPAPAGRLLVAAKPASQAGVSTLALYLRVGARWTQQYRYEAPVGVSYSFRSWRADGAAVRLEWAISGPTKACADSGEHGSIQLRDGPYGWDLVPPLPPTCR